MTTAAATLAEKSRAAKRKLAISAAPGRRGSQSVEEAKRVGIVLRPGMKQSEFLRVESRLERNRLARLPVIVGAPPRKNTPNAPICGLIIVGSDAVALMAERQGVEAIVRDAVERKAPVLALSDAVPLALAAIGQAPPETAQAGVLIAEKKVEALSATDIDRAIDQMASSPARQ